MFFCRLCPSKIRQHSDLLRAQIVSMLCLRRAICCDRLALGIVQSQQSMREISKGPNLDMSVSEPSLRVDWTVSEPAVARIPPVRRQRRPGRLQYPYPLFFIRTRDPLESSKDASAELIAGSPPQNRQDHDNKHMFAHLPTQLMAGSEV